MVGPCYFNGQIRPQEEVSLSLLDLGLLRGHGVFDFARTYQRRPFHLREHLIRLDRSARAIGLTLPHTFEEIEEISQELIKATPLPDLTLRYVLTGGVSIDGLTLPSHPTFFILTGPVATHPAQLSAITSSASRILPEIKSLSYLSAMPELVKAKLQGAGEILYRTPDDSILEGATTNLFIVREGTLITPREGMLWGITRAVVLRLSPFPVIERAVSRQELLSANEAFLTSTTREIIPLTRVDGHPIQKGPITQELISRFRHYVEKGEWSLLDSVVHA